jgi:hypothetical protein
MPGEQVEVRCLEAGDVIRVCHHHDCRDGECLCRWQTDAVVAACPAPVWGRLAVRWAGDARLLGGSCSITGISVLMPGEQVLRIGHVR